MFSKTIREKFLKYYSDEDLKKWFDPLLLNFALNNDQADFYGQANIAKQNSLPDQTNQTAFPPTIKNIQISFPHALFADWFKLNFQAKFENTLAKCLVKQTKIIYNYPTSKIETYSSTIVSVKSQQYSFEPLSLENNETKSIEQEYNFANFLYNRKNQFPVAAAHKFSAGQGQLLFILTANSGNGKSHLLYAIYTELLKNVPKNNIFFGHLDDLETIYLNGSKNGESALIYFRKFQYIILDNIDDAALKPELQDYIAKLIEYAHEKRIYCALSLAQKPCDCSFFNEKLRSLLESALIIELKKPDLDIRKQYIDSCCKTLNLHIKKDDALALARMYSGFRQIYGALLKVSEFKILSPQAVEAKLADILQTSLGESRNRLTPDHIITTVSEYLAVSPTEVMGKIRKQNAVLARHISMYLCRELLGAQFGNIGACFSDRDHSSVLYSVNKIRGMLKSDKDTNNLVTEVRNLCLK